MTISTIRRADDDDLAAVRAAAVRFCARHGIQYDQDELSGPADAIRYEIECGGPHGEQDRRIRRLWAACYCRALRVPTDVRTTIAYGHVGISL